MGTNADKIFRKIDKQLSIEKGTVPKPSLKKKVTPEFLEELARKQGVKRRIV